MARAQRLGVESPGEVANYALSVLSQLAEELEAGGRILVEHGSNVQELVFRQPVRAGQCPLLKMDVSDSSRPTQRLPHQ